MTPPDGSFNQVLNDAIAAISATGFQSDAQIAEWMRRLREAAERELPNDAENREKMCAALNQIYQSLIIQGRVVRFVPGVGRFTKDMVSPRLYGELDARITASVNLIKLNRQTAVDKTLQRFSGWSTSIPRGGSKTVNRKAVAANVAKPTKQARYEARRVAIDQGHKLTASIAEVVALGSDAIAAKWRHRLRTPGYTSRPDHEDRDGKIFLVRDSWAIKEGLIKPGEFIDQIERPGEFVFCSCRYVWILYLRDLPREMLTEKGVRWLEEAKRKAA